MHNSLNVSLLKGKWVINMYNDEYSAINSRYVSLVSTIINLIADLDSI